MNNKDEKIIIIGGGLSGLSAGVHLLLLGYTDVTIYEKNDVCGGFCTSWPRKGYLIDGCIHWMTGTNEESAFHNVWSRTGALEGTKVFQPDYYSICEYGGKKVTIWADPDKLNSELKRVSSEDDDLIDEFTSAIKAYSVFDTPADKPDELLSKKENMSRLFGLRSAAAYLKRFGSLPLDEFAGEFKSPILRKVISTLLIGGYNTHYIILTLNNYWRKNAGIPLCGSLGVAKNISSRFTSLGGKIVLGRAVNKVITEGSSFKGIELEGGETVSADKCISCVNAMHLTKDLLEGKVVLSEHEKRFLDLASYPLISGILVSFAASLGDGAPLSGCFDGEITTSILKRDFVYYRYYNYFQGKDGKYVLECFIVTNALEAAEYIRLKENDPDAYEREKELLKKEVESAFLSKFGATARLEHLDTATPATMKRYSNAYLGSYMSFVPRARAVPLPGSQRTPVRGLYLGGINAFDYGGIPFAMISGRKAAQLLSYDDGNDYEFV